MIHSFASRNRELTYTIFFKLGDKFLRIRRSSVARTSLYFRMSPGKFRVLRKQGSPLRHSRGATDWRKVWEAYTGVKSVAKRAKKMWCQFSRFRKQYFHELQCKRVLSNAFQYLNPWKVSLWDYSKRLVSVKHTFHHWIMFIKLTLHLSISFNLTDLNCI